MNKDEAFDVLYDLLQKHFITFGTVHNAANFPEIWNPTKSALDSFHKLRYPGPVYA